MTSTASHGSSPAPPVSVDAGTPVDLVVIGGSGIVGGLVLPRLAEDLSIRIFDLAAPPEGPWEWIQGDLTDPDPSSLRSALQGADSLLYLAMGSEDPDRTFRSERARAACFDVNVKALHLTLLCAHECECRHAVIASSMSVYHQALEGRFLEAEEAWDAQTVYGLTKALGEEVARFAVSTWDLSINVLRLCLPERQERWSDPEVELHSAALSAEDTAEAIRSAIAYRDGYRVFAISGDWRQRHMDLRPAEEALEWRPSRRPRRSAWSVLRSLLAPRRWFKTLRRLRG